MIFRHIEDMEGVIVGGVNINNLRYADDTVLLADSEGSLQTILNEVNEAGKTFNMKMNAKKTKAMIITKKDDKPRISTTIDGTNIEQVTNFPYLGQKITEDGRCEEEKSFNAIYGQHYNMELRHGRLQEAWPKDFQPLKCGVIGEC